jgi:hypothetical protein
VVDGKVNRTADGKEVRFPGVCARPLTPNPAAGSAAVSCAVVICGVLPKVPSHLTRHDHATFWAARKRPTQMVCEYGDACVVSSAHAVLLSPQEKEIARMVRQSSQSTAPLPVTCLLHLPVWRCCVLAAYGLCM